MAPNPTTDDARPVAFVTGASRGLGRACAVSLAEAGFDVAVSARTLVDGTATLDDGITPVPGGLDTTVGLIEAAGGSGLAIPMDLLDRASVLAAADAVVAHFGRVDVLVNNAIYQASGTMTHVANLTDDELLPLFEGNVHAQIALIRHLLPTLIAQGGGQIVNMISATAHVDPPAKAGEGGWGLGYAMTKAAFERVAPLLMVEHSEHNIAAYSLDPGHVVTERQLARKTASDYGANPRSATPPVIGAAVAWLVTDPESPASRGGKIVFAQREVKDRNLVPGWPPPRAPQ